MTLKSTAIRTMVLLLITVDVYALPSLVFAGVPAPPQTVAQQPKSSCGCAVAADNKAKVDVSSVQRLASGKAMDAESADDAVALATKPKCADVKGNCIEEPGSTSTCVFAAYNNGQRICFIWSHPIKIWRCPGVTYYGCVGQWNNTAQRCSSSSTTACPGSLPAGCPNPNPSGVGAWKECL